MSFQKMNLCAGVQVAMNVFHMFRNNSVNLVSKPISFEITRDIDWIQYKDTTWVKSEHSEIRPFDNDKLEYISELLMGGDYSDVRIYDVEEHGPHYEKSQSRLVKFHIISKNRRGTKIIFSVHVERKFADSEDVCGWTRWSMKSVNLVVVNNPDQGNKSQVTMDLMTLPSYRNEYRFHPQMSEVVSGLVYFC